MKKKSNKIISAILAAMLVVTSIVTNGLITTSAATGDTVYCETDGFVPYCYMLIDSKTSNGSWPGVKMTKVKDNIYSYTLDNDYVNIIFINGGDSKKTSDLIYSGDNTDPTSPTTTTPVPTTEPTTAPPVSVILGDANGNGIINVKDATYIQKYNAEI